MTGVIKTGDVISFAPNPRFPDRKVEATVWGRREDPRKMGANSLSSALSGRRGAGWIDTRDDKGVERSVRPSRATFVRRPTYACIGGTPAPDGGVHGPCYGHQPPCGYCTADGVPSPLLAKK